MPRRAAKLLISVPLSAALALMPAAAQAGGLSHMGTGGATLPNLDCKQPVSVGKSISINKPVTITRTITLNTVIDNSRTININKNIDALKTVNISKNTVIDKGSADAGAIAIATAEASATANAGVSVTLGNGGSTSTSFTGGSAYVNSGVAPEAPGPFAGGDLGGLAVNTAPLRVAGECTLEDATVIKAIHAVCVAPDGREFPASHMLAESWIESSYEGEVVRCIPGAHLKLTLGAVFQSSEGMASTWSHGQTLECGASEALRHYKDGMLKCAPGVPVSDSTEDNNLRRYGSGDMFFTYRTRVCRQTNQEYFAGAPEGTGGAHGGGKGAD